MGCNNCGGDCGNCSGCNQTLELTEGEISLLEALGQYSFLPAACRAEDRIPVYLEEEEYTPEQYSLILQCLEKKALINIDYRCALPGADMSKYKDYPVHGSIALTERGHTVLDLLEKQGIG